MAKRITYPGLLLCVFSILACGPQGVDLQSCLAQADSLLQSEISASYDEFTDSTTVTTGTFAAGISRLASQLGAVTGEEDEGLLPIVRFRCRGEGICRPDSLEILMYRSGSSRQLPDSAQTILLLDGTQRMRLGSADVSTGVESFLGEMIIEELARFNMSYEDFSRAACSDSVRYRVGDTEGALDSSSIRGWRALIASSERPFSLEEIQSANESNAASGSTDDGRTEDSPAPPPDELSVPGWMHVNRQSRSVTMELVAGQTDANNLWNYNGYHSGEAAVVVPEGWDVTVEFHNADRINPHSVSIERQVGDYPPTYAEASPVFPGAVTENPTRMAKATQPGESETVSFTASQSGRYALVCLVPAHANQGMWLHFVVSDEGEVGVRGV